MGVIFNPVRQGRHIAASRTVGILNRSIIANVGVFLSVGGR